MSLSNTIEFTALEDFFLDPHNPRLGRVGSAEPLSQDRIRELMRSWSLEELGVSFLESQFWPQEAVIVVREELYGPPPKLVVVEGNRRIAALKYLKDAFDGNSVPRSWRSLVEGSEPGPDLFSRVPYILADSRDDVAAFIGFRHVTGIKEWEPSKKAAFIAAMVDERGMSYDSIRKQIGSRSDVVRRNYIAYRLLQQVYDLGIEFSEQGADNRFSVLYLSLRESAIQSFLGINIGADPTEARTPVPKEKTEALSDFVQWLFGTEDNGALFTDSRYVGRFARVLASDDAVEYLRSSPDPSFDVALQKAGVEDEEIEGQLLEANTQMELALSRVHLHLGSESIQRAIRRLALNARELITKFPSIASETGFSKSDNTND